ncbi:MAG TPA: hypothetical protein VFJ16_31345 [Longimicrobium sp.]|nr:hypothetical protein [Longimicrobium sp.]
MKPILLAAVAAALAGCAPSPAPSGQGGEPQNPRATVPAESAVQAGPGNAPAASEADTTRIARLEREARAIAHADGCTANQCRTAPVGSRPCGGPRTYIVYCAAKTDSAALFAKLDELARAEQAFNQRNQMASTCEFREPPSTRIENGRCVAAPGVGMTIQ